MSLIANIAFVASDFVRHPFSDTGKTGLSSRMRRVVLDKKFASPTITKESQPPQNAADSSPLVAGDDIAAEAMEMRRGPAPEQPKSGMPMHKIALLALIVLTFGCLVANAALAFGTTEPYSSVQDKIFEALDWGFKFGAGAIVGVLTGKASDLPNT